MKSRNVHALAISLDTALFTKQYGTAFARQKEYTKHLGSYTLIVLNQKKQKKYQSKTYNNLKIIPTNSATYLNYIFDAINLAKAEINSKAINVITCQDPLITGLIGVILKKKYSIPLNIQLHSDYFNNPYWRKKSIQNRLLLPLGVWVMHQADTLRYDNQQKITHLHQKYSHITRHTYQAPMFIETSYFRHQVKFKKKITRIVSVGRLEWEKNFPQLINVIAGLINQGENISLTIVGGGSLQSKLQQQISRLKLEDKIKITGYLKRAGVKKTLTKSDLFVLNSYYEGWAMVTMEAAAAGLPVIMTNVGNAEELIINNKTGIVIPINNKQALKQSIKQAIQNPKRMYQLAKASQKKIFSLYQKDKLIKTWIKCLYETSQIKT